MKFVIYTILFITISFNQEYIGPDDLAGDVGAIRSSYMDGNRVFLKFKNTSELSDWEPGGLDNVSIWPNDGTGTRMVDGIALLVGAKTYILDDQIEATIDTVIVDDLSQINSSNSFHEVYFLQTSYREEMDHNFTNTLDWGFYPAFGYFNSYQDYPAMSDDENTWPSSGWPSVGQQTQWQGYWDGRFGKGVTYADLETYFVINDAMDQEYIDRNDFRYYPRPGKKIQQDASFLPGKDWGGLGLRVEIRGFQWNNPLVRDALFWEYNITNISDFNILETSFGYWVDNAIGSEGTTDDEVGYFDTYLDLSYSWDYDGVGQAGVAPGIMGFAFLESPGISNDEIDNDQDGIIDEKRDNDKGVYVGPTDGIDDISMFLDFYGLELEDLRDHWSGDEDQDWIQSTFDEDGNCLKVNDDVGLDGVGPGDIAYSGPDSDGTECNGQPDCSPGVGCEPNFGETDVSESDMIGLTTFRLFPVEEHSQQQDETTAWFYNDAVIWEMMSGNQFDQFLGTPANLVEMFASGTFELKKGQTERISMAELHSFDPLTGTPGGDSQEAPALFELKKTVQLIYETDYRFAQPPRMPTLTAESKDGNILLSWDNVAESSRDPFLPEEFQYDFEGYKIYKSTDKYFKDAQIITDGYGSAMFFQPVFQCDKVDGITGFSDITVFGTSYYLGDDTGIKHHFVDEDVVNGRTYYYALVAYDYGLAPTDAIENGIPPSENNAIIELDENEYVISTGINVAEVYAAAPSAGYSNPSLTIDDQIVYGTGDIEVQIIADSQIKPNSRYYLIFETDTQFVDIQDSFFPRPNNIYTNGFAIYECLEFQNGECLEFSLSPAYQETGSFNEFGMPNFSGQNFIYNEDVDSYVISDSRVITDIFDGIQISISTSTEVNAELLEQFWYQSNTDNPQIFIKPWPYVNHRESKIVPWDFDIHFLDNFSYQQSGLIPVGINGIYDTDDQEITTTIQGDIESISRSYPFYVYNRTLNDTMSLIGIDLNGNGFNPWEDRVIVGTSNEDGLWLGTTCEIDFAG
ncbi:MAG: hypothetical protein CMG26_06450, partial [Candidatus Marinimicrobia bacterium]|nr:hypothetical protein [Candidatus Neomarinimicrobiota bacterium]